MLIESASEILPLHAAADVLELSIESSFVFAVTPTVRIVAHSCSVCPLFCDEHQMCILPCLLKKLFEDPQLKIFFIDCRGIFDWGENGRIRNLSTTSQYKKKF